jgi:hypothetical protein
MSLVFQAPTVAQMVAVEGQNKRSRSAMWCHFGVPSPAFLQAYAAEQKKTVEKLKLYYDKFVYCKQSVCHDRRITVPTNGGTSSMINHLKAQHRQFYEEITKAENISSCSGPTKRQRGSLQPWDEAFSSNKLDKERLEHICNAAAEFFTEVRSIYIHE